MISVLLGCGLRRAELAIELKINGSVPFCMVDGGSAARYVQIRNWIDCCRRPRWPDLFQRGPP